MTPTPKLRFIERDSYSRNGEHFLEPHKVRILQQWWEPERNIIDRAAGKAHGEWRDVPLEEEQA
jgi:hypothetical protein